LDQPWQHDISFRIFLMAYCDVMRCNNMDVSSKIGRGSRFESGVILSLTVDDSSMMNAQTSLMIMIVDIHSNMHSTRWGRK
jgi:hypothetical protein